MASVATAGELAAVAQMISVAGAAAAWIGLASTQGVFAWKDGSPYGGYAGWRAGQPNTTVGVCGAAAASDGRWISANCTTGLPYVCSRK